MKREDLEVPFDIGMLVMKNKQLVVIISDDPKDERLADLINKNDDYYAFFVKDMAEYQNLADGFEKHHRRHMPIMIPHQMKQHQKSLIDFMELTRKLPINIPLHVADARTVEDAFDTSLLEEMRRGYGGDYMDIADFGRPESRSAAKALLPKLTDMAESSLLGISSREHSIGGDVYDRLGLTRRRNLDGELYKFGGGKQMITSPIRSDFHAGYGRYPATKDILSYQTFGGDWTYPHRKKNKPPAAAKVRGLNNNGMPSKRGKGRS